MFIGDISSVLIDSLLTDLALDSKDIIDRSSLYNLAKSVLKNTGLFWTQSISI